MKRKIIGRPSKYNKQIVENLCRWIRAGSTYKDACTTEGIHYDTFNEWRIKFSEFSVAIERAEALCKMSRVARILKASEKHWRAAAWLLERRFPDEYSLRESRFDRDTYRQGEENARRLVEALIERARGKK